MATGCRAFSGATQASLIAAILKEEPKPVGELTPLAPPALQRIIAGCLAKDPDERWQNAGDLKRELRWIASGGVASGVEPRPASPAPARRVPLWMLLPAGALLAGALFVLGYTMRPVEPGRLLRAALPLVEGAVLDTDNTAIAISPDGRTLAFVASTPQSRIRIWVRPMDGMQAQPLLGTEGASYPFWSPDGRAIGFFADGKLKKIPATGGAAQTLCDAPDARGASWSSKGVIAFSPAPFGGLFQVSAAGGTTAPLTQLEKEGMTHRLPHFLPDGNRLLFFSGNSLADKGNAILALDLTTKAITTVAQENSGGQLAPPSHLAFIRDGHLMVQSIDLAHLKITGEAIPIAEGVTYNPNRWAGQFTFSATGLLAFQAGGADRLAQLTWFDLEGKSLGVIGNPAPILGVSLSPDGKRAAVSVGSSNGADIWIYDLARGQGTRFTFAKIGVFYQAPLWSPDGRQIAFSNSDGEILTKADDGSSPERVVFTGPIANREPDSWSPDGKLLSVRMQSGTSYDEWIVPVDKQGEARSFISTPVSDYSGRFSPDGRWFSYVSNESGRGELYVIPFPGPGGKWQISNGGALDGWWLGMGLGILYQTEEGRLMTVQIQATGTNLQIGEPRSVLGGASLRNPFAVGPDGTRLLAAMPAGQTGTPTLSLVVNWREALSQP
jgi:serine/threonine-protein kinase